MSTQKSKGTKGAMKTEALEAEAYQWYLRKCRGLLEEAKGNPARSLMLERMLTVVANGKLEQNKKVATEAQAWKTELAKIKQSKEVVEFTKTARKAFADAQAAEAAYVNLMKRGGGEYGKMNMSPSEKQAIKKAIAAYRAVTATYPDTSFAAPAKAAADSLDIALSKAG